MDTDEVSPRDLVMRRELRKPSHASGYSILGPSLHCGDNDTNFVLHSLLALLYIRHRSSASLSSAGQDRPERFDNLAVLPLPDPPVLNTPADGAWRIHMNGFSDLHAPDSEIEYP